MTFKIGIFCFKIFQKRPPLWGKLGPLECIPKISFCFYLVGFSVGYVGYSIYCRGIVFRNEQHYCFCCQFTNTPNIDSMSWNMVLTVQQNTKFWYDHIKLWQWLHNPEQSLVLLIPFFINFHIFQMSLLHWTEFFIGSFVIFGDLRSKSPSLKGIKTPEHITFITLRWTPCNYIRLS